MFNEIIVANFSDPTFAAELNDANHAIMIGNPVCGDRIMVSLKLDGDLIVKARYQAWGCATSVAMGNLFCAHLNGRHLPNVHSPSPEQIEQMLGEIEPSQYHCLEMLKSLFAKLKDLPFNGYGGS